MNNMSLSPVSDFQRQPLEMSTSPKAVWIKRLSNALEDSQLSDQKLHALVKEGMENGWFRQAELPPSFLVELVKHLEWPQGVQCLWVVLEEHASLLGVREKFFGNTPLIWAIANANNTYAMEMIRRMEKADLDLQDTTIYNNTALHLAVGKGYGARSVHKQKLAFSNAQLVQEMIRWGADVNLCNRERNTPLHLACMRRDPEMIRTLLEAGANPLLENREGKTSLQLIELEYEQAHEQLRKAVGVFLLDKVQRGENFEEAKRLFKPPGASARA